VVYSGQTGAKIYETYGPFELRDDGRRASATSPSTACPNLMVAPSSEDSLTCRVLPDLGRRREITQSFIRKHEFGFGVSGCNAGDFDGTASTTCSSAATAPTTARGFRGGRGRRLFRTNQMLLRRL